MVKGDQAGRPVVGLFIDTGEVTHYRGRGTAPPLRTDSNLARCQAVGPGRYNSGRLVYRYEPPASFDPEGADRVVSTIQ
jgi:hypothetical protein